MASVPPGLRRRPTAPMRPASVAGLFAALYCVFAVVYILFSSRLAASLATSVSDLSHIEILKGTVFVIITAAAFFAISYLLLVRVRRAEEEIACQVNRLAEAERCVLGGIFASAVAHDINNALAVGLFAAEELRSGVAADGARALVDLVGSLEAVRGLAANLLELSRDTVREPASDFDLGALVRSAVEFAGRHRALRGCDIRLELEPPVIPFAGHAQLLRRALLNLILNASDSTEGRGTIVVAAVEEDGGEVRLRVDDDGPGIPPDQREAVLRPFFTTKASGTGIGMLSVVACARDHDGEVVITDSPQGGARVELRLRAKRAA